LLILFWLGAEVCLWLLETGLSVKLKIVVVVSSSLIAAILLYRPLINQYQKQKHEQPTLTASEIAEEVAKRLPQSPQVPVPSNAGSNSAADNTKIRIQARPSIPPVSSISKSEEPPLSDAEHAEIKPDGDKKKKVSEASNPLRAEIGMAAGALVLSEEGLSNKSVPLGFNSKNSARIAVLLSIFPNASNSEQFTRNTHVTLTADKDVALDYSEHQQTPYRSSIEFMEWLLEVTPKSHAPKQFLVDVGLHSKLEKFSLTITAWSDEMARHTVTTEFMVRPATEKTAAQISKAISSPLPSGPRVEIGIATGRQEFQERAGDLFYDCGRAQCFDEQMVKEKTLTLPLHGKSRATIAVLVKVYSGTQPDEVRVDYPHLKIVSAAQGVALNYRGQTVDPSRNDLECSGFSWHLTSMEHLPYSCIVDITVPPSTKIFPLTITAWGRNMAPYTISTQFIVDAR